MEERRWREELRMKETEDERRREELRLKDKELELKGVIAEKEEQHRESSAYKLKLWGDALRNTISKMPNESVETVSWFINLEHLCDQLKVPSNFLASVS